MILYHGSTVEIQEVDLSLSKPNKDFGKGFYLSDNYEQAYKLASYKSSPIANDKVGAQIRRFVEGDISFNTFLERLKYMKGITFQYFFGTEKAIQMLVNKGLCNE